MAPPSRSRSSRLFRVLLRLFPSDFRAQFGEEMDATFAAEREETAARGRRARAGLWLRTLGGAFRTAPREHWELLRRDVQVALRMLRRRPGFTLTVVATLGLGLGANAAVFAVLDAVVLRPLAFPHPERLVTIWERNTDGSRTNTTYATYLDLRTRTRTLQALAAIGDSMSSTSAGEGDAELLRGLRVTHTFFDVLGVQPWLGRGFLPAEDRQGADRVVVLSHELWRRRFGADRSVVGRSVDLAGRRAVVVGVLPPGAPQVLSRALYGEQLDYLSTLRYAPDYGPACRSCRHLKALARLRPGVSAQQAAAEVDGHLRALAVEHPTDYPGIGAIVEPLQKTVVGDSRRPLLALWGAVACLLAIAASNVASLLLARAAERSQELSLRSALGASRPRIVRQLATESLVLALLGGTLAAGLAAVILRAVTATPIAGLARLDEARLDARTLLVLIAVALLLALLVTLPPALRAVRPAARSTLARGGRATAGLASQRWRGALVVVQAALAFVLLAATGLLLASLWRLLARDPGFEPRGVLSAEATLLTPRYDEVAPSVAFVDALVARARALPGVESAGALHMMPVAGEVDTYGLHRDKVVLANDALAPQVTLYRATPGTDRALRLRLRAGRFFDGRDRAESPQVAVIGESVARRLFGWPRRSPLGERVQFGAREDHWRTVVGVVADLRHEGLGAPPPLQAYVPFAQDFPFRIVLLLRTTGDPERLAAPLRQAVTALDADVPLRNLRTLEQVVSGTLGRRRLGVALLAAFAGLALTLAAVGTYGLSPTRLPSAFASWGSARPSAPAAPTCTASCCARASCARSPAW